MDKTVVDQPWRDSKTVQFAVGATLIIVFAWWMFTGDIPFLSQVAFSEPAKGEDGNVQAVEWLPVVWGMLFQACVIVGASAIGLFSGIWSAVVRAIGQKPVAATESTPVVTQAVSAPIDPDSNVRGLVRAVAENDSASKVKFETQIRWPYAIIELNTAIEEGNFDLADERIRELKDLAGVTPAKKGGAK